jgi:hypothetical protein
VFEWRSVLDARYARRNGTTPGTWEQLYTGAANANKIAVLPKGIKFNKTQESNSDMQYAEGKRMNNDTPADVLDAEGPGELYASPDIIHALYRAMDEELTARD